MWMKKIRDHPVNQQVYYNRISPFVSIKLIRQPTNLFRLRDIASEYFDLFETTLNATHPKCCFGCVFDVEMDIDCYFRLANPTTAWSKAFPTT